MGVVPSILANHAASVCFHSVPMMVIHTVAGRESFLIVLLTISIAAIYRQMVSACASSWYQVHSLMIVRPGIEAKPLYMPTLNFTLLPLLYRHATLHPKLSFFLNLRHFLLYCLFLLIFSFLLPRKLLQARQKRKKRTWDRVVIDLSNCT